MSSATSVSNKPVLPAGPKLPPIAQVFAWAYRPTQFMERANKKYGETFTIKFAGFPPEVLFTNPKHIKEIFTGSGDDLHAGKVNAILEPLVGAQSVLLLDGKRHLEQRRLLLPPFHGERMHSYCGQMRAAADDMIATLPVGDTFALHTYTQRFTLDVILKTVFGLTEGPVFVRLRELLAEVLDGAASPLLLSKKFQVDLGPLTSWGRLSRAHGEIDKILFQLFDECRAENDNSRTDVLAMLVSAKHEDGSFMTFEELRDEMMTILVAGHETTATALAWAVFQILKTPGVIDSIHEELATVVGDEDVGVQHLSKLKYLDSVIKETLRLKPVIPIIGRILQKPMTIGGHDLPAGVAAVPCIYLTHRREDIYPEPLSFKPERFMEKTPGPYEFFPFGGGIRRCIGAAFAMYEMKIFLARVLSQVELELPEDYEGRITRRSITFAPEKGMLVRVKSKQALAA